MRHDLNRILDEECAERERKMREEDELLAAAARGAPFWGVGKPTDAKVVGLADFVPDTSAKSPQQAMNWSNLQHTIGDMFDEEELTSVVVQMPDGRLVPVVELKQVDRSWRLVLARSER